MYVNHISETTDSQNEQATSKQQRSTEQGAGSREQRARSTEQVACGGLLVCLRVSDSIVALSICSASSSFVFKIASKSSTAAEIPIDLSLACFITECAISAFQSILKAQAVCQICSGRSTATKLWWEIYMEITLWRETLKVVVVVG